MKKNFLLVCIAIIVVQCSVKAQKTSFAVAAGISSAFYSNSSGDETSDYKTGFTGGFAVNIKPGVHWSFQPGLSFVQKGGIEKDNSGNEELKATTNLNYLELPVNVIYSKRDRFFLGFGPFVGYALSGTIKFTGMVDETGKINFGSNTDELKPFDAGLNLLIGYKFKSNLFLSLNIATSLNNLSNDDSYQFENAYAGIKLGYMFGNKKK
jgi:hypothetical protein